MAKPTKSGGRNARPAKGGSGGSGAKRATKDDLHEEDSKRSARPSVPSAKEAAAKAVNKGPTKSGSPRGVTPLAKAGGTGKAGSVKRPAPTKRTTPPASARYTPPVPKSEKVSPLWVPVLMFTCLGLGMLTIILNYVNVLPGKDPSNVYLMIGLALITVGFVTATKYH